MSTETEFNSERIRWLPNCVVGLGGDVYTADEFIALAHGQPSEEQFNQAMDILETSLITNAIIGTLVDGELGAEH